MGHIPTMSVTKKNGSLATKQRSPQRSLVRRPTTKNFVDLQANGAPLRMKMIEFMLLKYRNNLT
jgi:hypothetical protein